MGGSAPQPPARAPPLHPGNKIFSNFPKKILFFPKTFLEKPKCSYYFSNGGLCPPTPGKGSAPAPRKHTFFNFSKKKSPISNFPKKILFFPKTSLEKPKFSIYFLSNGGLCAPTPGKGSAP